MVWINKIDNELNGSLEFKRKNNLDGKINFQ